MKSLYGVVTLVALLAGCASGPEKEVEIEDRGVAVEAATAAEKPAEKPAEAAVNAVPAAGGAAVGTVATTPEKAVTPPVVAPPQETAPLPKVETHVLADVSAEVKPMEGSAVPSPEAAAASKDQVAVPLKVKETVLSPPSRRVILFDYNSAAIRDEFQETLHAHVEYLKQNAGAKVILQGHTDERGSREYNLALGQKRAEGLFKAMNLLGVPEGQMEAVSLGEEKPLSDGHDEAAWQQNRRVEIAY